MNAYVVNKIDESAHIDSTSTSSTAQGGGGSFQRIPLRAWLSLPIPDGKANPLMDRKVVGAVLVEWLQRLRWSLTTTAGCSVV